MVWPDILVLDYVEDPDRLKIALSSFGPGWAWEVDGMLIFLEMTGADPDSSMEFLHLFLTQTFLSEKNLKLSVRKSNAAEDGLNP